MSRFDPFNLMKIQIDFDSEVPDLPQGVIDRLSAVMSLWHSDPKKASWYIDPKLAGKLWGPSRSGMSAEPTVTSKVEQEIRDLWLSDPERAILYVKPTDAIKRYGRPLGVDAAALVKLHNLYIDVHSHVGEQKKNDIFEAESSLEIYDNIHRYCGSDDSFIRPFIEDFEEEGEG